MPDDEPSGEEIRESVVDELSRARAAAVSYVTVNEDGEEQHSIARFCTHDDDRGPEEMHDHLQVEQGVHKLADESPMGALIAAALETEGLGAEVVAIDPDEAPEEVRELLGSLDGDGDGGDDGDDDGAPMYQ